IIAFTKSWLNRPTRDEPNHGYLPTLQQREGNPPLLPTQVFDLNHTRRGAADRGEPSPSCQIILDLKRTGRHWRGGPHETTQARSRRVSAARIRLEPHNRCCGGAADGRGEGAGRARVDLLSGRRHRAEE